MKSLRISADREQIVRRIEQLSETDPARWGRMSVHQMICHLTDGYRLALGDIKARPATGWFQRTVLKWIALRAPIPWVRGYPTRPEVEQGKGGTPPTDFNTDRSALLLVLARFCNRLPRPCIPHPVFGPMTVDEWVRWGYLHADHHLRQFGR